QSFCAGAKVSDLKPQGSNVKWYSAEKGGVPLDGNTLLLTNTVYYASQTSNGCESTQRAQVRVTLSNALTSAPVAAAAKNPSCTSAELSWTQVPNAIGYYLDMATDINFNNYVPGYINRPLGNQQNFSPNNLTAGTQYFYRVRAYNICGSTADSNIISFAVGSFG